MSWSSKVVETLVLLYRRVHRYLATSHSFCYKGRNVVPPWRNTIARSSSSTLSPVASLDIVCEYSCLATRESSKEIEFAYLLTFASESRGWHGEKDQKSEESRSSSRRKLARGFTSWNTSTECFPLCCCDDCFAAYAIAPFLPFSNHRPSSELIRSG